MGSNTTTQWTCDVCGAEKLEPGTTAPRGWNEATLQFHQHGRFQWSRSYMTCAACIDTVSEGRPTLLRKLWVLWNGART